MGTVLKILLALIVGLIVLVYAGSFALASDFEVKREITIQATPEEIHPMVHDLQRWPEWSAWNKEKYPSLEYNYEGETAGVGGKCAWTMDEGPGRMEITASSPDGVWYDLYFGEPEQEMSSKGVMEFKPEGEATRVVWTARGELDGVVAKYMGLAMDSWMGPDMEQGLEQLKAKVEAAE